MNVALGRLLKLHRVEGSFLITICGPKLMRVVAFPTLRALPRGLGGRRWQEEHSRAGHQGLPPGHRRRRRTSVRVEGGGDPKEVVRGLPGSPLSCTCMKVSRDIRKWC